MRGEATPVPDQHPPGGGGHQGIFRFQPLSQFMDQNNPLAELTHKRRLSLGTRRPVPRPGGL